MLAEQAVCRQNANAFSLPTSGSTHVADMTRRRIRLKVPHPLAFGPGGPQLRDLSRFRERLWMKTAKKPLPIMSGEVGAQRRVRDLVKKVQRPAVAKKLIRFPRDSGLPRMNKTQLKSQTLPTRGASTMDRLYSTWSIETSGLNHSSTSRSTPMDIGALTSGMTNR